MAMTIEERVAALEPLVQPVQPEDTMAEAGRKVLLTELVNVLKHEAGSRTGEDIEDVHDMRVATRRMRSLFQLLASYYKQGEIRPFSQALRRIAGALGDVRDLDVLIENLQAFQKTLEADQQASLQTVIDSLDKERSGARKSLNSVLDSKTYRRFIKTFTTFLTHEGAGSKSTPKDEIVPLQIRHVLPSLIYNRLAAVLAYEPVLEKADAEMLHGLRIEFKRLRYTVSLFEGVLGTQIADFIDELKELQDCLGHLNDATSARALLDSYEDEQIVAAYLKSLEDHEAGLQTRFTEIWSRFSTRKVQQKLSTAVLALR